MVIICIVLFSILVYLAGAYAGARFLIRSMCKDQIFKRYINEYTETMSLKLRKK